MYSYVYINSYQNVHHRCTAAHTKGLLLPIPPVVHWVSSWKISYSCCVLFCNNKFTLCLLHAATKNSYLMHMDFPIMTSSRGYPLFIARICHIKPVTSHTLKGEILYPKDIFMTLPWIFMCETQNPLLCCSVECHYCYKKLTFILPCTSGLLPIEWGAWHIFYSLSWKKSINRLLKQPILLLKIKSCSGVQIIVINSVNTIVCNSIAMSYLCLEMERVKIL